MRLEIEFIGEPFGLPQWKLVCYLVPALDLEITAKGCHIHGWKFGDEGCGQGFKVCALALGFCFWSPHEIPESHKP